MKKSAWIIKLSTNININIIYRLIAEKINKNERKSLLEIVSMSQGHEEDEFWDYLGGASPSDIAAISVSWELLLAEFYHSFVIHCMHISIVIWLVMKVKILSNWVVHLENAFNQFIPNRHLW